MVKDCAETGMFPSLVAKTKVNIQEARVVVNIDSKKLDSCT